MRCMRLLVSVAVACLAAGAANAQGSIQIGNLGANEMTLEFQSLAAGTEYFTRLPGSNATCGTAAQTKAGEDANGTVVRHGSLGLTANVQGQYTVRNLMGGTAYTVCFTLNGTSGPASASFTTAAAATFNSPGWNLVGSADFSPGGANFIALVFAPDGTPYMAFQDGNSNFEASVMEFNGSAWVNAGNADFSPGEVQYLSLAFAPDGTPYVGFMDTAHGSKATVMKLDGSAWAAVGNADFSAGMTDSESLAFAPDGTPYLAFRDAANGSKATVMKFDGNSWVAVGSPGFTPLEGFNNSPSSLAFAPDGTPTVVFSDNGSSGNASVMSFNGSAWVNVGSADFSPGAMFNPVLAFGPDGTAYVEFADQANSNKATVMEFNGAAWVNVGNADFSAGVAADATLAIGPDGRPYVGFGDGADGDNATVMEFDGAAWANVGNADFSPGAAFYESLAFAPDGTPFLAFQDGKNGNKTTVMRLNSSGQTTPTVTAWPTASSIAYGQMLADSTLSGGTASVSGTFAWSNSTLLPGAGVESESVIFTPDDTAHFTTVSGSVKVTVNQANPAIVKAPTASPILVGQTLSASTLSGGVAFVPGAFAWTSPATVISTAGSNSESVTFTPADSVDYTTATTTASVLAIQATTATANLGANQVTLEWTSSATGSGFFTVLPGSSATCGSAAQTAAGEDSTGTATVHGSLALTANTQGQYTVRNLMASTAYTVCFTPDGVSGPVSASFTTTAEATFNPGAWSNVGSADFSSGGAYYESVAFATDGTPYLAFADNAHGNAATVVKFDGSTWTAVGSADFSPGAADFIDMAFSPQGTPFVAFGDNINNDEATVMEFNGTAWVTVGNADFSRQTNSMSLAIAPDGSPWVAIEDGFNGHATAMKFNGTAWVNMGNADFSPGGADFESLAIAPDGTPYVAFGDETNFANKATVMKLNGSSWVNVGNADFTPGEADYLSLVIAPDGTPFLGFEDAANSSKATVMKFDGTAWANVGSADFSPGRTMFEHLTIAPDGNPYLAFQYSSSTNHGTVAKFNGTAWVTAGGADFSGKADFATMAFAPDGTPYVAFPDGASNDQATVMRLTGAGKTTPTVTAWPTASAITFGQTLAASTLTGGSASVAGAFAWTDSTIAPKAGAQSESVTFTPTDTADFTSVTGSVNVTVNQAVPTITTAPTASSIQVGEMLSASTLSGGAASVPGTFAWTSPATVISTAGSNSESVTFTPTDAVDFTTATTMVNVVAVAGGQGTIGTANLEANQVTLQLTSSASGTGYFTLLPGSGATCGTAAQTAAGEDATGTVVIHGSLSLTASTQGQYTVRNLMASTAYTVCFTPDGVNGPVNASFTTAAAATLSSPVWTNVGSADFTAGFSSSENLAFAPDGTPFLGYQDGVNGSATVMEFTGAGSTGWVSAGNADFSPLGANPLTMAFAPSGTPYVAFPDSTDVDRATAMELNGSAWTTVGNADFSSKSLFNLSLAFAPDGTPWVAFGDGANSDKATVMKLSGGTWVTVGTAGFSPGSIDFLSLQFAPDGTPYVAFDNGANPLGATVMKFDGTAWVGVGSAGFSPGDAIALSFAIAPDGTPYVGFMDDANGDKATVMKFDGAAWVNVGGADFTAAGVYDTSIAIAPDGTPWLAFGNKADGQPVNELMNVMKFNGSAWVSAGNADFSPGGATFRDLAFAPDGTPYLAFRDGFNNLGATVMRLKNPGPATPTITTLPTASAITFGQTLAASTLSGGTASVAGAFAWTDSTVAPKAGVESESVTFTPTDTADFTTVTGTVNITVNKATPTVTAWPAASAITFGQTLAASTLSGGSASVAGSFAFTAPGTAPATGAAQEGVTFTPTDGADYNTVAGTVTVTVNKATPTVTAWPVASAITYGQTLAASTLSGGTASVAGSFAFTAPATAPGAGTTSASVTFAPKDSADYNTVTGTVSVTVNKATPTIGLASSQNPATLGLAVTFTATVSSSAGTPTGTVTFWSGTTQLGSGALTGGVATFSTSALAQGAYSITAQYSGDANFASVTSTALAQAVIQFSIAPAPGAPSSGSGVPGGFVTYQLTVVPPSTSSATFAVTGLPSGFTATFNPSTVAAGAGPTNVTLTIHIPSQVSSAAPARPGWLSRMPVALGLILLPLLGVGRRGRRLRRMLLAAVLAVAGLAAAAGLSGCSHHFSSFTSGNGNPPPPGSYTVTVTATAGSLTQSTTLTLNVQ